MQHEAVTVPVAELIDEQLAARITRLSRVRSPVWHSGVAVLGERAASVAPHMRRPRS